LELNYIETFKLLLELNLRRKETHSNIKERQKNQRKERKTKVLRHEIVKSKKKKKTSN